MPDFCVLPGSDSSLVLQTEHPPAAGVHQLCCWRHNSWLVSVTHGLHSMRLILNNKTWRTEENLDILWRRWRIPSTESNTMADFKTRRQTKSTAVDEKECWNKWHEKGKENYLLPGDDSRFYFPNCVGG